MGANILRYYKAFEMSQMILSFAKINMFPLDVIQLVENHYKKGNILFSTLSDFASWNKAMNPNGYVIPRIKDARCYYYPDIDIYIIVYNERQTPWRTRFSLAHELGHIVLEHLHDTQAEISRGGVSGPAYYWKEGEANTFAGNILAPPILIHERLNGRSFSINDISSFFRLSATSVKGYRKADYEQWCSWQPSRYEKNILEKCRDIVHPKKCKRCNHLFYLKSAKYCWACGCKYLSHYFAEDHMKYKEIKTNDNGLVAHCLKCDNEDIIQDGSSCHICGTPVKNECCVSYDREESYPCTDAANTPLPGNARFCPYCGSETSFKKAGLLEDWESEKSRRAADELADFTPLEEADTKAELPF